MILTILCLFVRKCRAGRVRRLRGGRDAGCRVEEGGGEEGGGGRGGERGRGGGGGEREGGREAGREGSWSQSQTYRTFKQDQTPNDQASTN